MKDNLMMVVLSRIKVKTEDTLGHENHPPWDNSDDHVP